MVNTRSIEREGGERERDRGGGEEEGESAFLTNEMTAFAKKIISFNDIAFFGWISFRDIAFLACLANCPLETAASVSNLYSIAIGAGLGPKSFCFIGIARVQSVLARFLLSCRSSNRLTVFVMEFHIGDSLLSAMWYVGRAWPPLSSRPRNRPDITCTGALGVKH